MLAPYINQAFRDDARFLGLRIRRQAAGLYLLTGLPFTIWLVETDAADPHDPVLMLMGRELLKHRDDSIHSLRQSGHDDLLKYALQQIKQFRLRREEFTMQHSQTRYMDEMEKSLKEMVLEECTTEERLRDLPLEEIARALGEQKVKELVELAQHPAKPASKRKHR